MATRGRKAGTRKHKAGTRKHKAGTRKHKAGTGRRKGGFIGSVLKQASIPLTLSTHLVFAHIKKEDVDIVRNKNIII